MKMPAGSEQQTRCGNLKQRPPHPGRTAEIAAVRRHRQTVSGPGRRAGW